MKGRRAKIFVLLGAGLAVVLAAMVWMTQQALDADRRQLESERRVALEESVRLSLWRLDTALTPLAAGEAARPHGDFVRGTESLPEDGPVVLLFAFRPDGSLAIPAARTSADPDAFADAVSYAEVLAGIPEGPMFEGVPVERRDGYRSVDVRVDRPAVSRRGRDRGRNTPAGRNTSNEDATPIPPLADQSLQQPNNDFPQLANANPSTVQQRQAPAVQQALGDNEFQARNANIQRSVGNKYSGSLGSYGNAVPQQQAQQAQPQRVEPEPSTSPEEPPVPKVDAQASGDAVGEKEDPRPPRRKTPPSSRRRDRDAGSGTTTLTMAPSTHMADVLEGMTHPKWVGDHLVLARRTTVDGELWIEGSWIDWPRLEAQLETELSDLLPGAKLMAVRGEARDTERLLATLPIRLIPGELPINAGAGLSPLELSLIVAWVCVLFAVGAFAALLLGALALSERRGAFVSAVTHELRTPLTTFRMYTEMLDEGMVADDEQRSRYVGTLRREADRLGNLVENVLAYARIEGKRAAARIETLTVADVTERVRTRLEERLAQAGMTLSVDLGDAAEAFVSVDPTSAEQILFNLVDNAAKYAPSDSDPRVELAATPRGTMVEIHVRDHGPGVPDAEAAKIFRPFEKAEAHEAGTAAGVGLGLALCRRLARQMGGDLVLQRESSGAHFVLSVPRGSPRAESEA